MQVELIVRKDDYANVVADLYTKGINFSAAPSTTNADEYVITLLGF